MKEPERKEEIAELLQDIERYNPEHLPALEEYVQEQCRDGTYDLEANLAVLKLYQFNPTRHSGRVAAQIMLKALANLPHPDFTLCKCLLNEKRLAEPPMDEVLMLAERLEQCTFHDFWQRLRARPEVCALVSGFPDAARRFVCHVVSSAYQRVESGLLADLLGGLDGAELGAWVERNGWRQLDDGTIFIANQDEKVKPRNITERIDLETAAAVMATL